MNFDELIRYHNEGENLDFKLEFYKDHKKVELIKDVLAFANAKAPGNRYIIFGIKKSGDKIHVNPINDPIESAHIEEIILANIKPEVGVSYEPYFFEGQQLAILTIREPQDRPYAAVKQIKQNDNITLRENEMLIRKGSHRRQMERADLDRIYSEKFDTDKLDGKVNVTFLNGTNELEIPCIRNIDMPSARIFLEVMQEIQRKENLLAHSPRMYLEQVTSLTDFPNQYSGMDLNQLKEELRLVQSRYASEDIYYLQEERGIKINFQVTNNGEYHLEGAMVQLTIPKAPGFYVATRIALNTYQMSMATGINYQEGYPKVELTDKEVIVLAELGEVRHQFPTKVFGKELRIAPTDELAGKSLEVSVKIFGRQIRNPTVQLLTLHFV